MSWAERREPEPERQQVLARAVTARELAEEAPQASETLWLHRRAVPEVNFMNQFWPEFTNKYISNSCEKACCGLIELLTSKNFVDCNCLKHLNAEFE
jgi:hypothetical protein